MRSPEFYESVWAAAYAAAHVSGKEAQEAALAANDALDGLLSEERVAAGAIARREELFRSIRTESVK